MTLPTLIASMLRPEFYPHRPSNVTLVQTHISYVFLAGDRVYKIKKPVRFSFLDFSTLERRRHFCHEEVRLNRRLAPDVYRGVEAICQVNGEYRLVPSDHPEAIEYLIHMRRLPAERMLDQLLDQGQVTASMIDAIAARVAEFHTRAAAGPEVTANGDPAAVARVLEDNYTNACRFRDVTIAARDDDAIQSFARDFLRTHEALFLTRQTEHRIRDGHGDLHSEHICFAEQLEIFDCVEFNPLFRYCDVASEVAFLAMDLDYHDRPDLAEHFIARYAAHAADRDLHRLVPFYQCYRAYVRGKVDSLKGTEEEVDPTDREAALQSARRHFALAYRYTWAYRPALVVVTGLSGTGKSAVAAALHQRTGFVHFNSDRIRKRLAGVPPEARRSAAYGVDLYSPEHSERTYAALFAEAAARLGAGRGVILDATFQLRKGRDTARALAAMHGMALLIIECHCGEPEVRRRLDERARRGDDPSDAGWDVYLEQRHRFEPFAADECGDRLILDTTRSMDELIATIEEQLGERIARTARTS